MQAALDLLKQLGEHGPVLLTGPDAPDGDSIGACLALRRILRRRGTEATVAGRPGYRYAWMPDAETMVPDAELPAGFGAVVVLDGDRLRLTAPVDVAFRAAPFTGIIDHHGSTSPQGYTTAWLEPQASSTCEMLYDALTAWQEPLDEALATQLYVGSIFDTGCFRYSNTTPATHRMAAHLLECGIDHARICAQVLMERQPSGLRLAGEVLSTASYDLDGALLSSGVSLARAAELGIRSGDWEGIVESMVFTSGVQVVALFIERQPGRVKVSLRSRGRVDVAQLAHGLSDGGGGHPKAAGVTLDGSIAFAHAQVRGAVVAALQSPR